MMEFMKSTFPPPENYSPGRENYSLHRENYSPGREISRGKRRTSYLMILHRYIKTAGDGWKPAAVEEKGR